jgi:parallel beta-helix repeat protein
VIRGFSSLLAGWVALSGALAHAATYYVDPANPAATDGGRGAAGALFKTLGAAVPRLMPGDRLLIAGGTYRESIDLRRAGGLRHGAVAAQPTRIEAAPGAQVVIKGSEIVSGWERLSPGLFVKRHWSVNTQQVFVDGAALRQIGGTILGGYPERKDHPMARLHVSQGGIWPGRVNGGLEELTDDSFYYDAATRRLYVKVASDSIDGRVVEASTRPYLLIGEGMRHLRVSRMRFEHANTTDVSQSGAISLSGDDLLLDHIDVQRVDGNGFDISGNRNTILDSSANHCGQVGMKVRGRHARLIGNETSHNNTRGFNKWWEAGGAKFVGNGGLQDSEVSAHRAYFNNGDGIWFDWKNRNNDVHDNVAAYNRGMGIHYEASSAAHIHDNHVFGNAQRGIYLPKSSRSLVVHNLVVGNGLEGIAVIGETESKPEFVPRENRILANILGWNGKGAIVLPSQALDNVSDSNLFLDAQPPALSLGWGTREQPVLRGLAAWRRRSGQDQSSAQRQLAMPASLADALKAQAPRPDWSVLRDHVADLRARGDPTLPGPKEL